MTSFTAARVREVQVQYKTLETLPEPIRFAQSRDVYQHFRAHMMLERVETFQVLLLNAKNRLIGVDLISRGSLQSSIVHPREVFSNAVRLQAGAIMLMHNHPSGDPAPSKEDRDCTVRLMQCSEILGIRILDHIVFGDSDYYSFADAGSLSSVAA